MFFDFGSGILLCMCKGVKGDWSSEAEYCCACARALKETGAPDRVWQEFREASKVEQAREKLTPYFQGKRGEYAENPTMDRLLKLLVQCRVEGAITDEIRKLMQ